MVIPKLIESLIYLVNLNLLNQKFKGIPFRNRPQLNRIFILAFAGWFIYITLDIIIYIIAPMSMTIDTPLGEYHGYNLNFPSLLIANILRDVGMLGAFILNWHYLIAAVNIKFGEKKTNRIFANNWWVKIPVILLTVICVYGDRISVTIFDHGPHVRAMWHGFFGIFLFLTIIIYLISAGFLIAALRKQKIKISSPMINKKLKLITIGILLMASGHFYWFILGFLQPFFMDLFANLSIQILFFWIGHLLWMMSAIFIYFAIKMKITSIDK